MGLLQRLSAAFAPLLRSILLLPLSSLLLLLKFLYTTTRYLRASFLYPLGRRRLSTATSTKTVLITGVGTPYGLSLARLLHSRGHIVVGADLEVAPGASLARRSNALRRYHSIKLSGARVGKPLDGLGEPETTHYWEVILRILKNEKPDLWVPCSSTPSPGLHAYMKDKVEKQTHTRVFHFGRGDTAVMSDQSAFVDLARSCGLSTIEQHTVSSRSQIHRILSHCEHDYTFSARPIAAIESRPEEPNDFPSEIITLPAPTMNQTYQTVSMMNISGEKKWTLKQNIEGQTYSAFAVVVRGEIRAFAAYPMCSSELIPKALGPTAALNEALFACTRMLCSAMSKPSSDGLEHDGSLLNDSGSHLSTATTVVSIYETNIAELTGHLKMTFIVVERVTVKGVSQTVYPTSCEPGFVADAPVFEHNSELANVYLSALDDPALMPAHGPTADTHGIPNPSSIPSNIVLPTPSSVTTYLLPDLLQAHLLRPIILLLTFHLSLQSFAQHITTVLTTMLTGHEELSSFADPLPAIWKWHVIEPLAGLAFLSATKSASTKPAVLPRTAWKKEGGLRARTATVPLAMDGVSVNKRRRD